MKGDTIKLLSDDDGSRKRGVPCGHLARQSFFFKLSLLEPRLLFGRWTTNGDGADCEQLRRDGEDAEPCKCRWCT